MERRRLLGFITAMMVLSHLSDGGDYPDAQNLGTMDQMMALKWIHENISGFGGDPDSSARTFPRTAGRKCGRSTIQRTNT